MPSDWVRLAVIGDPIDHSLSPPMHEAALEAVSLSGSCERVRVSPADLKREVERLKARGYRGFNVTIPLKERILACLDEVDARAHDIRAVNTVGEVEGRLVGYNTDAVAMDKILSRLDLGPKRALVLGAGGAARACVHALTGAGWAVTVANRTRQRALQAFGTAAAIIPMDSRHLEDALAAASLIVNATSVGMDAPTVSPLDRCPNLSPNLTLIELVYAPLQTRLVSQARAAGCRVVDGLTFLAGQGAAAFEIWTGRSVSESLLRSAALAAANGRLPEGEASSPTTATSVLAPQPGAVT